MEVNAAEMMTAIATLTIKLQRAEESLQNLVENYNKIVADKKELEVALENSIRTKVLSFPEAVEAEEEVPAQT